MSIPAHHLEQVDDLKTPCACGQPGRYIYWGLEIIVCSEACAEKANKEVDEYFRKEEENESLQKKGNGDSAADSAADPTWPD